MRIVKFKLELRAEDIERNHRTRWNGEPMPSDDASEALREAVEAFQRAMLRRGFVPLRTGYGVTAYDA